MSCYQDNPFLPPAVLKPFTSARNRAFLLLLTTSFAVLPFLACSKSGTTKRSASLAENGWSDYHAGHFSEAAEELRAALRIQPRNPEFHYRLGVVLRDSGQPDAAMNELYKAHQIQSDYADSVLLLAQLMVKSNDVQYIRWSGDFARRILSQPGDPRTRAEAYYVLGVGSLRLNDPNAANSYFNQALQENPDHVGSLCFVALQYADRGNVAAGEQVLRKALARDPKSLALTSALAEFCRMAKQPSEAEAQWKHVLELDAHNVPAQVNLVDLFSGSGRSAEAENIARRLSQQPNTKFEQWYALLLWRNGRNADAVAELTRLSRNLPEQQIAQLRLIAALIILGKQAEASALIDEAPKRGPQDEDFALMKAQLALDRSDRHAAETLVDKAMRMDPSSGSPHLLAARLADIAGVPPRANYELGEALRLQPTLQSARLSLARRYIAAHDGGTALGILDGAPYRQRSSYPILMQRSWALLTNGNWSRAGDVLSGIAALEQAPDIWAQDALLAAALGNTVRKKPLTAGGPSEESQLSTDVAELLNKPAVSPQEIKAFAPRFGSQPQWETYGSDLLVLPRGLLRSVLDPDGYLTLHSFGLWEPMIDAG